MSDVTTLNHKEILPLLQEAQLTASDLDRARMLFTSDKSYFHQVFASRAYFLGFSVAALVKSTGEIIDRVDVAENASAIVIAPPKVEFENAKRSEPLCLMIDDGRSFVALRALSAFNDTFLYVTRPIDPFALEFPKETQNLINNYDAFDAFRTALQRAFLLRSCSDGVFSTRTRPCLQYQIRRCTAPCVGRIDKDGYQAIVDQAEDFLSGGSHQIQERLSGLMEAAANEMDYESAAVFRDRIRAIDRGGTAGQLVDALDERGGDGVDVDRVAEAERRRSRAVDQHQRPTLAEVAQLQHLRPERIAPLRTLAHAARQLRNLGREILDRQRGLQLDLLLAGRCDGAAAGQAGNRDPRSRHHDVVACHGRARVRRSGSGLRVRRTGHLREGDGQSRDGYGMSVRRHHDGVPPLNPNPAPPPPGHHGTRRDAGKAGIMHTCLMPVKRWYCILVLWQRSASGFGVSSERPSCKRSGWRRRAA